MLGLPLRPRADKGEIDKMKSIKIAVSVCILVGTVFAQTAPITLNLSSGHLVAKNTSSKEVIAFVIQYDSKKQAPNNTLAHDFYFKPHGVAPAELRGLNDDLPSEAGDVTRAKLLFTQSVDGSIWGDSTAAAEMLSQRGPMKQFYQAALASYEQQGEAAFLDRLNQETEFRGHAMHLLQVQKQAGTQAAVNMVKERLVTANSRPF
jgi:hypothetical protein